MEKFLDLISGEMKKGFSLAGYEEELGKVTVSNRPDLCEYQCNGAMAGAKKYHKAPIAIAQEVAAQLEDSAVFAEVSAVAPGFLNLKIKDSFVRDYVAQMAEAEKFGLNPPEREKTIVLDYGGPNVAKPLHVGHLRSAVIGESIKRICRYNGVDPAQCEQFYGDQSEHALAHHDGGFPQFRPAFAYCREGKGGNVHQCRFAEPYGRIVYFIGVLFVDGYVAAVAAP